MVRIGKAVVIIDALIGEVRLSPHMKHDWFMTMPSNAAKNIFRKSFGLTFSSGVNNETIQKSTAAPIIRQSVSNIGDTPPTSITLPSGALMPHRNSAPSIAP